jgi:hypothetical protein
METSGWRSLDTSAGRAVVEATADVDHDVTLLHRVVGGLVAVHAEHAQKSGIIRGQRAQAFQRRGHRQTAAPGEAAEFLHRIADDHASADDDQRPPRAGQHFVGTGHGGGVHQRRAPREFRNVVLGHVRGH